MTSSYRLSICLLTVALLVPAQASAKNKRNWHLGDRTLKRGREGHDVKVLQDYLARAGIETEVDGVFGRETKRAVRAFEAVQRREVDGVVTKGDVAVLKDVAVNGGAVASTGGALPESQKPAPPTAPAAATPAALGPGMVATVGADGYATAPALAPPVVQAVIAAGNRIARKPYIYGGGHGKWEDVGYDCSGSVSYALHGAGLLDESMASGGFMKWGALGRGQWITVYANPGHMYMVVAGLRFDTSGRSRAGTRWQKDPRPTQEYVISHPAGL